MRSVRCLALPLLFLLLVGCSTTGRIQSEGDSPRNLPDLELRRNITRVLDEVKEGDNSFYDAHTVNDPLLERAKSAYQHAIQMVKAEPAIQDDTSVTEAIRTAHARLHEIEVLNALGDEEKWDRINELLKVSAFGEALRLLWEWEDVIQNAPAALRERPPFQSGQYEVYSAFGVIYTESAIRHIENRSYSYSIENCKRSQEYLKKAYEVVPPEETKKLNQIDLEQFLVTIHALVRENRYHEAATAIHQSFDILKTFSVERIDPSWYGWKVFNEIYAAFLFVALERVPNLPKEVKDMKEQIRAWLPSDFHPPAVSTNDLAEVALIENFDLCDWVISHLGGTPPQELEAMHTLIALVNLKLGLDELEELLEK